MGTVSWRKFYPIESGCRTGLKQAVKSKNKYSPLGLMWLCIGVLCLGLGVIGIFVPLLPTTIFILIAAFAFARSSDRLHAWIMSHRLFGPVIQDWQNHGAVSRKGKIFSTVSMILIVVISFLLGAPLWLISLQMLVLGCVAIFLLTRPLPPNENL